MVFYIYIDSGKRTIAQGTLLEVVDIEMTTGNSKIKFEDKIYFIDGSQLSPMDKTSPIDKLKGKSRSRGDSISSKIIAQMKP